MESIKLIGAILGGLGLFLLAISMMTDGLKLAAGASLRKLLSESSKTPLRGIFSGLFMTAIVQSSSAVTVASLGFVNAGLINMRQALGIIYGSNIGTTMTGWLVAIVGFKMNIQAFALPLIGIGMALKLMSPRGKNEYIGLALVGFGLFFVGIDILRNAFDGIVQAFDITSFKADGVSGILMFLLIGLIMTILTQSSSASIALTITAASSGMVGLYAAGAMVIGANIGTTSTALIASMGATSQAKRVAAAQVIFNASTAIVALLILPILLYLINSVSELFHFDTNVAISLALFHSVFNILGVILIFPHNERLASYLDRKFCSSEEMQAKPRYLDKTIAQTPVLAINALTLETAAISHKVRALFSKAINTNSIDLGKFKEEVSVVKLLSIEVSKFIVNIERVALNEESSESLAVLMRIDQYLLSCALSTERLASQLFSRETLDVSTLECESDNYYKQVLDFMKMSSLNDYDGTEKIEKCFSDLLSEHDRLKASLISNGTRSKISVAQMLETIDCLAEALRLSQQWFKAITRLRILNTELALLHT